jgi:hypothetical protein
MPGSIFLLLTGLAVIVQSERVADAIPQVVYSQERTVADTVKDNKPPSVPDTSIQAVKKQRCPKIRLIRDWATILQKAFGSTDHATFTIDTHAPDKAEQAYKKDHDYKAYMRAVDWVQLDVFIYPETWKLTSDETKTIVLCALANALQADYFNARVRVAINIDPLSFSNLAYLMPPFLGEASTSPKSDSVEIEINTVPPAQIRLKLFERN